MPTRKHLPWYGMRGNSGKRPRYLIIPRVPASCSRKQPPAFMPSYLGIAATSIEYDKFDMAEIYIQKALDYKRTNEAWFGRIPSIR